MWKRFVAEGLRGRNASARRGRKASVRNAYIRISRSRAQGAATQDTRKLKRNRASHHGSRAQAHTGTRRAAPTTEQGRRGRSRNHARKRKSHEAFVFSIFTLYCTTPRRCCQVLLETLRCGKASTTRRETLLGDRTAAKRFHKAGNEIGPCERSTQGHMAE